jgi:hypothetical protein
MSVFPPKADMALEGNIEPVLENPWKAPSSSSNPLNLLSVENPSNGRGRRFNPYSTTIRFRGAASAGKSAGTNNDSTHLQFFSRQRIAVRNLSRVEAVEEPAFALFGTAVCE